MPLHAVRCRISSRASRCLFFLFLSVCLLRLLDAVSLDLALDDAFYLLDRSLQEESIDLQSYTKQLRALSRKQFYARALIIQIQQQQTAAQSQSGVQLAVPQQQHMQQHMAIAMEARTGLVLKLCTRVLILRGDPS